MKVILQGFIEVPISDLSVILKELPKHIQLTLNESGCLTFSVERDKKHANRFNVYEEFVDQDSFLVHQQRVKESRWGKVSKNVRRHYVVTEN